VKTVQKERQVELMCVVQLTTNTIQQIVSSKKDDEFKQKELDISGAATAAAAISWSPLDLSSCGNSAEADVMPCMVPSMINYSSVRLHLYTTILTKRRVYSIEIMYALCMCESLYEIDTLFSCVILRKKRGWCKIAESYKYWFVNWKYNQALSLFLPLFLTHFKK